MSLDLRADEYLDITEYLEEIREQRRSLLRYRHITDAERDLWTREIRRLNSLIVLFHTEAYS